MKKILSIFVIALACHMAYAQQQNRYPALSDSKFANNPEYQSGNKYQRDAILYMDMLVGTHPYYIKKERRDSLMATQSTVLEACGKCSSDTAFTQILYGVLGKLHDKHTDVIDTASLAKVNMQKKQKQESCAYGKPGEVMAYGGDLFHYRLFPEHSICYLQFNQCADARTQMDESLPRWDTTIDEMFGKMKEQDIKTLVVDAQYNGGGSSMLCDELLIHLMPLEQLQTFSTYLRFSDLMGTFNPRIAIAKKSWEEAGHIDELYPMPKGKVGPDFVQPEIYHGNVIFVQSKKTYSSAGMLMTLARDNRLGTIVGETSSYSPSHYGEILPFSLPNTCELGSVCTKFFARPDSAHVDDDVLEPMVELDLTDKTAAWQFIVNRYGVRNVKHPQVTNEEYIELAEIIARFADNSIFNDDYAPRYQADIDKYFAAYKDHPAVVWLREHETKNPWINYDAIPWIGAHAKLEGGVFQIIPNCDPKYKRWPKKYVKEFLPLMTDFYHQTNFHKFYLDHSDMYSAAVDAFRRKIADYIDLDWFAEFFGSRQKQKAVTFADAPDFCVVMALNNGAGSFGIQRRLPGQKNKQLLSVMLYGERKNGTPAFNINDDETLILVHEFCHSYLTSPKAYKNIGQRLLAENREKMKSVGYGIWQNIIEESLVRISVIRYMIDHNYTDQEVLNEINSQHEFYGFKWLPSDIEWYRGDVLNLFETIRL